MMIFLSHVFFNKYLLCVRHCAGHRLKGVDMEIPILWNRPNIRGKCTHSHLVTKLYDEEQDALREEMGVGGYVLDGGAKVDEEGLYVSILFLFFLHPLFISVMSQHSFHLILTTLWYHEPLLQMRDLEGAG